MKNYERFISKDSIEKIHAGSMRILEEIGVLFEHEGALNLFRKHGYRVEGQTVFINEKQIEESLKKIPSHFNLYVNSEEKWKIGSNGHKIRMPAMGNIYITEKGKVRKMRDVDIIQQFKLGESSPIINSNHLNYFTELSDYSREEKMFYYVAFPLMFSNKPSVMAKANVFGVPHEEVYEVVRKGVQIVKQFYDRDDQVVIGDINPISPLAFDYDPIARLFAYCAEKQPIWICPCAMPMMTAPPSVASMVAQTNAEILAGFSLIQLIQPGTPVIYGNTSASTNMKTLQLSIGAPETALVSYATAGLADLYHLPLRTGGGLSDAKDLDAQAGLESMLVIQATEECNPDLVMHSIGTIGSFNVVSFEKYLLDEEIWQYAKRLCNGVRVDDETLCFKESKKAGPRGSFIAGRTPKLYRQEFIIPQHLNKEDPNQWQNEGGISLKDSLSIKVKERIENYQRPNLTKKQKDILMPYLPARYKKGI